MIYLMFAGIAAAALYAASILVRDLNMLKRFGKSRRQYLAELAVAFGFTTLFSLACSGAAMLATIALAFVTAGLKWAMLGVAHLRLR